jgi:hypothetical protein
MAGCMTAVAVLVTGCGGGPSDEELARDADARRAADCSAAVESLLGVTQRYLDTIEGTSAPATDAGSGTPAQPTGTPDPAAEEQRFSDALGNIRGYAGEIGCDPQEFQAGLADGLAKLATGGPVARAVLLQLQADAVPGRRAPRGPIEPADDLAAVVAGAASSTVLELAAGTFELPDTLVLLRGVTLRGAGREATVLRSAAAGGVVLLLTGEDVALEGLGVERVGDGPGPVISAAPTATLTVSAVRVTGARADAEGLGGVGILMAAGAGGQTGPARRTSLRLTDSDLRDNAVAGVVVAGEHRAEVLRTTVTRSGQCGVCFLDTSDGVVRESTFTGSVAGVVAAGDARPSVQASTIVGGEIGIQAGDRAAPAVQDTTIRGSARAALLWTDTATGRLDGNRCVDVEFGIVVGPQAAPFVGENDCAVARTE